MKKYLLFLLLMLAFAPCSFAQTSEDALAQARDYVSNQMVLALLQNVKDSGKYKSAYDEISQPKKVEEGLPADALQSIIKSTSDSILMAFAKSAAAIDITSFTGLKNEAAAKAIVGASFTTLKKYYPDQSSSIESKRKLWTTQVAAYFNKPSDDNNTESFVSTSVFYFSMLLLLTLLAATTYYLLQRFKRIEQKLALLKRSETSSSISKDVYYDAVNKPQTQKQEVAKLIDSNRTIAEFQKAIETLQTKVSKLEAAQSKPAMQPVVATIQPNTPIQLSKAPQPNMAAPQPARQEPPATEVFYMGGPVSNYFPANVKSLSKENTVYKFTVKANKEEALFELHTAGAPIKEIVSLSESYIKPACDEENIPPATVRNIVTAKPGLALLEGDKWMIKNKALIRYE